MTPAEELAYGADLAEEDFAAYIEWLFPGVKLWEAQKEMARSFFANRETAVKSCHSSGKTFCAAACIIGKMILKLSEPDDDDQELITVAMSAKEDQLKETIFAEIPKLLAMCRIQGLPKPQTLKWLLAPKLYLTGDSSDNATTVQGKHAKEVNIVIDEAAGLENAEVFKALRSLTASGKSRVLYLMNPTRSAGPEVDLFQKRRVTCMTIDAFKSPNFWDPANGRYLTLEDLMAMPDVEDGPLDDNVDEHLISRRYVRELVEDEGLGPASGYWPRARGEFPQQDLDSLILREYIEAAHTAHPDPKEYEEYKVTFGLDVSGGENGGDESVLYARQGPKVLGFKAFKEPDDKRMVSIVTIAITEFSKDKGVDQINIDSAGIGRFLHLALQGNGWNVVPVNVGRRAFDKEQFANLKAEDYWSLRERFRDTANKAEGKPYIYGPLDPLTMTQLANIRYRRTLTNQIEVERKKEAKKRGVASPDRAEALMLCFAGTPSRKEARDYRYVQAEKKERQSKWRKRYSTTGHLEAVA